MSLLIALLAVFVGQATVAHAGTLGGIAGTITDSKTGTPLAGVKVQITSPSEAVTATTDAHGHYAVLSLQPDNYTLTAVKSGYAAESFTGYSVYADQTQQYDLQLTPSSDSQ